MVHVTPLDLPQQQRLSAKLAVNISADDSEKRPDLLNR